MVIMRLLLLVQISCFSISCLSITLPAKNVHLIPSTKGVPKIDVKDSQNTAFTTHKTTTSPTKANIGSQSSTTSATLKTISNSILTSTANLNSTTIINNSTTHLNTTTVTTTRVTTSINTTTSPEQTTTHSSTSSLPTTTRTSTTTEMTTSSTAPLSTRKTTLSSTTTVKTSVTTATSPFTTTGSDNPNDLVNQALGTTLIVFLVIVMLVAIGYVAYKKGWLPRWCPRRFDYEPMERDENSIEE